MRQLSDYVEFLRALKSSVVEKVDFQSDPDLIDILRNPRLLIVPNHATPLSWIPFMCVLADEAVKNGGGDRIPRGVADRWFYSNPLTKLLAEYLTQSEKPQNFEELVSSFRESDRSDLVIFPEGANSFFGSVHEVGLFRSHKFIEISIRCQAPILLVAHRGSENWSLPLQFPKEWGNYLLPFSKFFGNAVLQGTSLNIPIIPHKLPKFAMACRLYVPELYESDLSQNEDEKKEQLRNESDKVRDLMNEMLSDLDKRWA